MKLVKPTTRVIKSFVGLSGLITAYPLRKFKPIILEQSPRFGGNAKGQSGRGLEYSIGAAFTFSSVIAGRFGR
jgi:protoporphyrinogen oxidase